MNIIWQNGRWRVSCTSKCRAPFSLTRVSLYKIIIENPAVTWIFFHFMLLLLKLLCWILHLLIWKKMGRIYEFGTEINSCPISLSQPNPVFFPSIDAFPWRWQKHSTHPMHINDKLTENAATATIVLKHVESGQCDQVFTRKPSLLVYSVVSLYTCPIEG